MMVPHIEGGQQRADDPRFELQHRGRVRGDSHRDGVDPTVRAADRSYGCANAATCRDRCQRSEQIDHRGEVIGAAKIRDRATPG
jgi:hypothetical protein